MLSEEDKENSITGAQKGTATHVFLQFCSFDRLLANGFENELEQLVRDKFISEVDSTLVDKDSIEKFMKSRLLNEQILKARSVHREFRFNLLLDANDFTSKKDLPNEKILVQGVMDCILELDDGRLVLIDYKTDKVTPNNYKDELKERYENQLKYYKLACEKIFGKKVFEVKLYSVPVGDDFALDIK
jgi:ATP-dependent helicase/nuclease subunit A